MPTSTQPSDAAFIEVTGAGDDAERFLVPVSNIAYVKECSDGATIVFRRAEDNTFALRVRDSYGRIVALLTSNATLAEAA